MQANGLNYRVVVFVQSSLEDFVDLADVLLAFQALFNYVGREFELAEPDKVACDEVQDLVIPFLVIELENVLHEVVAIWIFDKEV